MGDGQLQFAILKLLSDLIALDHGSAKRLFHVNMAIGFGASHEHLEMLIDPTRANRHQIERLLAEHLPIIRVAILWLEPFLGLRQPLGIRVGKCNDLDVGQFGKWHINRMSVITSARCTDDPHAVFAIIDRSTDTFHPCKNSTGDQCALEVASIERLSHGSSLCFLNLGRLVPSLIVGIGAWISLRHVTRRWCRSLALVGLI